MKTVKVRIKTNDLMDHLHFMASCSRGGIVSVQVWPKAEEITLEIPEDQIEAEVHEVVGENEFGGKKVIFSKDSVFERPTSKRKKFRIIAPIAMKTKLERVVDGVAMWGGDIIELEEIE